MKNLEIERKFLVSPELDLSNLPIIQHKEIIQGYIYNDKYTEIRVRSTKTNGKSKYYYTVKISGDSLLTRIENEFEISEDIFMLLIDRIIPSTHVIVKDRYVVELENNLVAELDVFDDNLEGLTLVEVEFSSQDEANSFEKPVWFGEDVTLCKEYKNKNLAKTNKNFKTRKREIK